MSTHVLAWLGIAFCITQSAMFSGLNLAMFGLSRLRLEIEASNGSRAAARVLALRTDSNFLLTTILWGNVGINVLLTLLSNSVLAGVSAFFFSTILITLMGEIVPQAYFVRNALRMGALLAPVLRVYQLILYPAAKPTAKMLDWWLGKEGIHYYREHDLRAVIRKHVEEDGTEIDHLEGVGALNFLALDDLPVAEEGELADPASMLALPVSDGHVVFPEFSRTATDPFLQAVNKSGKKWVILTDLEGEPKLVMNANAFLRTVLFGTGEINPGYYCHRPVIVRDPKARIGQVLMRLKVHPVRADDDVIDRDLLLMWAAEKRVITGSDILGRLMRGIIIRDADGKSSDAGTH